MGGTALFQILLVIWYYIGKLSCSKNIIKEGKTACMERRLKRKQHNMSRCFWNFLFLFIGNILCVGYGYYGEGILEVVLMVLLSYFVMAELVQFYCLVVMPALTNCDGFPCFLIKLGEARYLQDPENYLEIFFWISVPLSIFVADWELIQPETDAGGNFIWNSRAICRGFVALGVFCGWIELTIKIGNVSYSIVGDFIKMFYTIIRTKLFAYMKVCFLLVTAFSLAFWIVLEGQTDDTDQAGFSKGVWFSQVLTTTMSTGEFNTGDFYDGIKGNGFTKLFALLFLMALICFSTITMINLLVAAIITDYNKMKDEVDEENLYFIAEYIIEIETQKHNLLKLIQKALKLSRRNKAKKTAKDFKLTYCPHLVCNNCKMEPLPLPRPGSIRYSPVMEANDRNPLLHEILEKRKARELLCEDHKYEEDSSGELKRIFQSVIKLEKSSAKIERILKIPG